MPSWVLPALAGWTPTMPSSSSGPARATIICGRTTSPATSPVRAPRSPSSCSAPSTSAPGRCTTCPPSPRRHTTPAPHRVGPRARRRQRAVAPARLAGRLRGVVPLQVPQRRSRCGRRRLRPRTSRIERRAGAPGRMVGPRPAHPFRHAVRLRARRRRRRLAGLQPADPGDGARARVAGAVRPRRNGGAAVAQCAPDRLPRAHARRRRHQAPPRRC